MTDAGVLVVGYGNSLRGDDGIGWHAARLLTDDPRLTGARVLTHHQLAPELAEALYGATPPMVLVSVAAASFADGDGLSSALERALPKVVETVAGVVTGQQHP